MNIVSFSGSLRSESYNKKLLHHASDIIQQNGHQSIIVDFKEYQIPLYDQDFEAACGIPESVKKINLLIKNTDGIIIATPEYNGSISGVLKNFIDWISREDPMPIAGKQLLLMSTSPSFLGGVRGLWHTRIPFEAIGVHVYPTMFTLPFADKAFEKNGQFVDEKKEENFKRLVNGFLLYCNRNNNLL